MRADLIKVDALAQEIRRVDGNNSLGAGALAEALMPFLADALASQEPVAWRMTYTDPRHGSFVYYDEKPWTDRPNTSIEPLFASPVVPVAAKAEAEGWRPEDQPPERDDNYWVYQEVPPQSHPMQVGRFRNGRWLSSWPVLFWRDLPAAPTGKGDGQS